MKTRTIPRCRHSLARWHSPLRKERRRRYHRILIATYCTMHELVRVIGNEKALRTFFGPTPLPTF